MTNSVLCHLQSRFVDLELHRPVCDEERGLATFFLYNLSGKLVGYQQYNPKGSKKKFNCKFEGKYYTYRKEPTVSLFGTESLYNSRGVVFLVEGVFDATRLTYHGQSALATLCNNPPKDYYNFLSMLNRPIVCVCDNDVAGVKLSSFGDYVEVVPNGKDLGEADDDYVQYLLNKYSD